MIKKTVIGLMSGTSLDGLDICAVDFTYENKSWDFELLNAETIKYSKKLKSKFISATRMSSLELIQFDVELGQLMGRLTKQFIISNQLKPDFIASHGHTIFHQPNKGFTLQVGSGQNLAIELDLPVVFDFRSKDVTLGGQGAPLVPIGDKKLFPDYNACINLGGIANVSFDNRKGERVAFDICPFNMGLNYLANRLGFEYDDAGVNAKKGKLNLALFEKLNQLDYYTEPYPKSLGVEWFENYCLPLINDESISVLDRLHTFSQHIAQQIKIAVKEVEGGKILITGGGAYNSFVIEILNQISDKSFVTPSSSIIDFKEALIFAFLGMLRMNDEINVLKSVTGAQKDSSSGIIALP